MFCEVYVCVRKEMPPTLNKEIDKSLFWEFGNFVNIYVNSYTRQSFCFRSKHKTRWRQIVATSGDPDYCFIRLGLKISNDKRWYVTPTGRLGCCHFRVTYKINWLKCFLCQLFLIL